MKYFLSDKNSGIATLLFALSFCFLAFHSHAEKNANAVAVKKVLFIGDSITMHSPRPEIGWNGNWGMAASAEEKDFVHLFYDKLCKFQGPSAKPELLVQGRKIKTVRGAGRIDGHLQCLDEYKNMDADLIIIQIGENERPEELTEEKFGGPYEKLINGVKGKNNPLIFCTGVWRNATLAEQCNRMIMKACTKTGAHYVSIEKIRSDYLKNSAEGKFENAAVASHPGDNGHTAYAELLWDAYEKLTKQEALIPSPNTFVSRETKGKNLKDIGSSDMGAVHLSLNIKPGNFSTETPDHFTGIKGRGIFITLRDGHIGCAVDGVGGTEKRLIGLAPENGKENKLDLYYYPDRLEVLFKGQKEVICDPPFPKGSIELITWNQEGEFSDISLSPITIADKETLSTKNLLRNGSFEKQSTPGLPDGWSDGLGWGIEEPSWTSAEGHKQFFHSWTVDSSEHFEGKYSMKVTAPLSLMSMLRPLHNKVPHCLSLFMKSPKKDSRVVLEIQGWDKGKFKTLTSLEVNVDTDWKRFVLPVPPLPTARAYCTLVKPKDNSIVYCDCIQLEEGGTVTEFADNPYSSMKEALPPFKFENGKSGTETAKCKVVIVDGKPELVSALVLERIPPKDTLAYLKESGYDTVAICVGRGGPQLGKLLDDAASLSMKCVVWFYASHNGDTSHIDSAIAKYGKHPAVLAWWVYDEPWNINEPFRQIYEHTKKEDPAHPVIVNYTVSGILSEIGGLPGDIISYDDYPIPDRPAEDIFANTVKAGKIVAEKDKPLWAIHQSFGNAFSRYRSPTPSEFTLMVYSSILNNASGILFFAGLPRAEKQWARMKELNAELKALKDILLNGLVTRELNCGFGIYSKAIAYKGKTYLMALNPSKEKRSFDLPLKAGKEADILFENRKLNIVGGHLQDSFAPFERHVYVLDGEKIMTE